MSNLLNNNILKKAKSGIEKFSSSKPVTALINGMGSVIGLTAASAMFSVVGALLTLFHIVDDSSPIITWLSMPSTVCLGIIGLVLSFTIAYEYAKLLGLAPVSSGVASITLFILVVSPITNGQITTTYLGSQGMCIAMLIALVSVKITDICKKKNIVIKMPDSIPEAIANSFTNLIPLFINILFWYGLDTILINLTGNSLPVTLYGLIEKVMVGIDTLPAVMFTMAIAMVLWIFGVHGTAVVWAVLWTPLIAYYDKNAALQAAGLATVYTPIILIEVQYSCGGDGILLPFCVQCLRSKSERLKAVGKVGILPALFNISEPIVFGSPIPYNTTLAVPYILAPMLSLLAVHFGFVIGFFKPFDIFNMANLPVVLNIFFKGMYLPNLLIPVVMFIIGYVVYYPFWKKYDAKLFAEEQAKLAIKEEIK